MKHRRTPRFVKAFQELPTEVKAQARKAFLLFQEERNGFHRVITSFHCVYQYTTIYRHTQGSNT